jgi:hypothetical protein
MRFRLAGGCRLRIFIGRPDGVSKGEVMKRMLLLLAVVMGGAMLLSGTGCETPALTTQERFQLIGRNWGYEYEQSQDDVDDLFLLRPSSHLTQWDVQSSF